MKKNVFFLTSLVLVSSLSGCATLGRGGYAPDKVGEANALIDREKAGDARYLRVKGREYLVFDHASMGGLEAYAALSGADAKRTFLIETVKSAKVLGDQAVRLEVGRVPLERMKTAERDKLLSGYAAETEGKLADETEHLGALVQESALDRYQKELAASIESSIKTRGRTARQLLLLPLSPFVNAWMAMHEATKPKEAPRADFESVTLYRPLSAMAGDPASMDDAALLEYYAPEIAVQKKADARYDIGADRFGAVRMDGATVAKAQPKVDGNDPVVYGYVETKNVQNVPVKMLVYTLWFPERPNVKGGFDPEVGSMQGSIIRISLDRSGRPVVYENVSSCGCYYKIFPTERLERWAIEAFGAPSKGKHFTVETDVRGKIDADVPSLVPSAAGRVVALYASGTHDVLAFRGVPEKTAVAEERTYRLRPYEDLESLPFNGAAISLFDETGLVRNAARLEATLLAASGMYSAGTPRQRGTLMIYFDQADFDDPHLLERYLRLPEKAFERAN